MVDKEHSAEPRETFPSDPVRCLLSGEQLITAGNYSRADAILQRGIDLIINDAVIADDDTAELAHILASLHYTRAESMRARVVATADQQPEAAAQYLAATRKELGILEAFNKDRLVFISPHVAPTDETLRNNGLVYLVTRTQGMLELHVALRIQENVEAFGRGMARAYSGLYAADEALASGIYHEKPLMPPHLPTQPNDTHGFIEYKASLEAKNAERRNQRRAEDPELATALQTATTLLTYRPERLVDEEGEETDLTRTIVLPRFEQAGPRVSDIFAFE